MKTRFRIISLLLTLIMFFNMSVSSYAFLIAVTTVEEMPASVLTATGEDWAVNITINPEEDWPENLEIRAEEVKETTPYLERIESEVAFARFFDLGLYADGVEIQPEGRRVKVEIEIPELENENVGIRVVHFTNAVHEQPLSAEEQHIVEQEEPLTPQKSLLKGKNLLSAVNEVTPTQENVEEETSTSGIEQIDYEIVDCGDGKTAVSFVADGFSVYGIVGTIIEKTIRTRDGNNYKVTVRYGPETGIPEDADLSVEEILPACETLEDGETDPYQEYAYRVGEVLGWESASYLRLFDIKIVDKDNPSVKYQPAEGTTVEVRIELADKDSSEEAAANTQVVHFGDDTAAGDVVEAAVDGQIVSFEADGFSVYAIVDAPDPSTVNKEIYSLDEIEAEQEYYLSIVRSGKNYMTSNCVLNNGTYELSGTTSTTSCENWLFEFPEEGKINIYYLGSENQKMYLNIDESRNISFSENAQPLLIEETTNLAGTFYIYTVINNKNYALSVRGNRNFFFEQRNNGANANERVVLTKCFNDPYNLDSKTFGIAYHDESVTAAGLMAEETNSGNRLAGLDMLMRPDVLTNDGILLVAEDSDITEWTFESIQEDKYYIKTTVGGNTKYLTINNGNVSLQDEPSATSVITATPGTGTNAGKWHFTVNNYSLNYTSSSNNFNAINKNDATTWMNLVEKSTLTEDDFVEYSARKISASDDILSATEKDENGGILKDEEGNPVYKTDKAKVIIYTRVWNDNTKKYEFFAVDHDGSLVRIYDSGDLVNWVGNKVNSALWEFSEYTYTDGTPNYYYELENVAYPNTFLAPQSSGVISRQAVGLHMEGRQEGYDYTNILAWDEAAYAYSGLKVEGNRVVTCPLEDANDFYFAVVVPPMQEANPTTTVETVDNDEHGITIKMIDFNNPIVNNRDSVQNGFFYSTEHWQDWNQNLPNTGLLSTNLVNDYPIATDKTQKEGHSFSGLFNGMTSANHLFIQSVYKESGYFEYDSTQNFAHLNESGNFTVYNQLGAIGTDTGATRTHGQFMPYNDISAEVGYAYDTSGNLITNNTDVLRNELSDTNPRKGEPLYSIPQNEADYYFGMELSASFTQTPNGLDNWGHDIIFEFTGDDDFWFYVDGELILDLGGVHSALAGSVNFRTGEVICNGTHTTLYEVFESNYQARGMSDAEITAKLNDIFVEKVVNGETVKIFNDYTSHEMKMFYMERGAGASNLKMRFNLASVQRGTVELSKKLTGTQSASNKLMQYPYQIWYKEPIYQTDESGTIAHDGDGNPVISGYGPPVQMIQGDTGSALSCVVYKGTKKLVPFRKSMEINGETYYNVFLLKAGETAVIKLPDANCTYEIIECGVDTEVYEKVYVNGVEITEQGSKYNNNDTDQENTDQESDDTNKRLDFGIDYNLTGERPRVEYTNQVAPGVMRTLSFKKVLYDTEGHLMSDEEAANASSTFSFRLYLGNEYADENNLALANMYSYYVKDPNGYYCKWNPANKCFESLNISDYEGTGGLAEYLNTASSSEKSAIVFTTSLYGSISNIPVGYTVEVRDLIVGTKYKVEERDSEIPKGFTRRDSDGYVRTDLGNNGDEYIYYTDTDGYGNHLLTESSTITAEAISDTIASKTDSPMIEIRNQEGWGLTAEKKWTDKDFMIHDPIYLAVYLKRDDTTLGDLVEDSVRILPTNETEVYWFFQDLRVNNETYRFDQFIVREVKLTGTPTVDENTGVVTGYTNITPIEDGASVNIGGKTISGVSRTETYTVSYNPGDSTGQNANIRTDTVTNSRPGIQIYKTDWDGSNYLAGAVFTLKDSDGNDVGAATYTSNSSGLVTTAYLSEGTFTLDEIETPAGYVALDEPIMIKVTTTKPDVYDLTVTTGQTTYYIVLNGPEGFYTTDADTARITIKNRTVQELKVVKVGVDGETRTPLKGVHFALYEQVKDSEGNLRPAYIPMTEYENLETDENGVLTEITMELRGRTYYLREMETSSGYKKLADDLCFTIGDDGSVTINTPGYKKWLSRKSESNGTVSYQIEIENTPLGITIRKTDVNGNPLPGAQFTLIKEQQGKGFVKGSVPGIGEDGILDLTDITEKTLSCLENGLYKLTETNAPDGYIITTKDIFFVVSDGAVKLTDSEGQETEYSTVTLADEDTTIVVKNTPGVALPSTGGTTPLPILVAGTILTTSATVLALHELKRRRREDN